MSVLDKDVVKIIAEGCDVAGMNDDAALAIAAEAEYRIREVIQESLKFCKHCRRTKLMTEDVNSALRVMGEDPIFGHTSNSLSKFVRVTNTKDLWVLDDKEVDLNEIVSAPLPKCPLEPSFTVHWLAINGVQPLIPQNPSPAVSVPNQAEQAPLVSKKRKAEDPSAPTSTEDKKKNKLTVAAKTEFKPPVRHVLSKELQLYFENVTSAMRMDHSEPRTQAALRSLAQDPGLTQLLPYFTQFIAEAVLKHQRDLPLLFNLMRMAKAILASPHLNIEPYLHQLLPAILTCVVGKKLCQSAGEDHWTLRDFSAQIIALICNKFSLGYPEVQPQITRTLLGAFIDSRKPLTTHYGAITGLVLLGPRVVETLILPNLQVYFKFLKPELESSNPVKRLEVAKVYGALLSAFSCYVRWQKRGGAAALSSALSSGQALDHMKLYETLEELFGEPLLPYVQDGLSSSQNSMCFSFV